MTALRLRMVGIGALALVAVAFAGTFAWKLHGTTLASAAVTQRAAATATTTTFDDAFAYCAGVGDKLHPDSRYTGPAEPVGVVRALERALGSKPGTLDSYAATGTSTGAARADGCWAASRART